MLQLRVVLSVQTFGLNAVCTGRLPNLSCENYLPHFCTEQQIHYIRARQTSCCSHTQDVIFIQLFCYNSISENPIRSWLGSISFSKSSSLCSSKLMDEGQPCFPPHFCLHPCCIEFQTRARSSLVPPDRTSVSIREYYWCLPPSLYGWKKGTPLFSTISHIVHIWECSIVLYWTMCCIAWDSLNLWTLLISHVFQIKTKCIFFSFNTKCNCKRLSCHIRQHLTKWGHIWWIHDVLTVSVIWISM